MINNSHLPYKAIVAFISQSLNTSLNISLRDGDVWFHFMQI